MVLALESALSSGIEVFDDGGQNRRHSSGDRVAGTPAAGRRVVVVLRIGRFGSLALVRIRRSGGGGGGGDDDEEELRPQGASVRFLPCGRARLTDESFFGGR